MKKNSSEAMHVWLVMLKASRAIGRYTTAETQAAGLGESEFRVLEVLLHRGPLPVNTIGPKVDLTPASISEAVDRLYGKGYVSRVESPEDRRVRIVSLTPKGKALIVPAFAKRAAALKKVFSEFSAGELQQLEAAMKRAGRRAEVLAEGEVKRDGKTRDL